MAVEIPALPSASLKDGRMSFSGLKSDPRRSDYTSPDGVYIVHEGASTKRIRCFFEDSQDPPVAYDPTSISATINNRLEEEVRTITYSPGAIHREKLGSYYYDFTTPLTTADDFSFFWNYANTVSSGTDQGSSMLYVIPKSIYPLFPQLRAWVDKAAKVVGLQGVGYTDSILYICLRHALQEINAVQPITNLRLTNFPIAQFGSLLIETAVIIALFSQGMFAIDTDIPTYNDQGTSLNLDHWAKIQAYITALAAKLGPQLKLMKMDYLSTGSITLTQGPALPLRVIMASSPGGLFRGLFTTNTQNWYW